MLITDSYKALNEELHRNKCSYGTSGYRWAERVRELFIAYADSHSILDYGCGKATLSKELADLPIANYDPSVKAYNAPPEPAAILVCTDVLEHIEPECLDDVLAHIASLMKDAGLLTISTRPANKVLSDGRNAHLIVEGRKWWLDKLAVHFTCRTIDSKDDELAVVIQPKENP